MLVREGGFVWGVNHALRITATLMMIALAWTWNRVFHSVMTITAVALLLAFIVIYTLRLQ